MSEGTILLVDDEKLIRDLLVEMLSETGTYTLLTAENGKEALAVCAQHEIDLVFTDLRMPVMEGLELLAELRRTHPQIPVVILTGCGRREDVIEAMRLGASNFLMKPQEVDKIRSIAGKILRMKSKEKLEQEVFSFLQEERQNYAIASDARYALPLINQLTEKIVKVGICNEFEIMNIRLALDEALMNAIVHGNLEISSCAKGATLEELQQFNRFLRERSQQEPYRHRRVKVELLLTRDFVRFTIEDEGTGFDWQAIPTEMDEVELMANHGRGLFLIRAFMNDVTFNERGNRITLTKYRQGWEPQNCVLSAAVCSP
jgi:YesN/AraC family two-component response regulator